MNHLTENARLAGEQRFAYKIRQRLNEAEEMIPADRLERLAEARKAALRVHAPKAGPVRSIAWASSPATAGGGTVSSSSQFSPGLGRFGLAFAAIALVGASLIALFQFEDQQRVDELADVDAGVLTDDLPISAYADHGFNAFLKQNQ